MTINNCAIRLLELNLDLQRLLELLELLDTAVGLLELEVELEVAFKY